MLTLIVFLIVLFGLWAAWRLVSINRDENDRENESLSFTMWQKARRENSCSFWTDDEP
jgi:hypothetical protein